MGQVLVSSNDCKHIADSAQTGTTVDVSKLEAYASSVGHLHGIVTSPFKNLADSMTAF
jgi:hypothetical protein